MKKLFKYGLALVLAGACSFNCQARKQITVGVDASAPPFCHWAEENYLSSRDIPDVRIIEDNDEISGLDMDVIDAVAYETNLLVKYVVMPFPKLFEALDAKKVDMIASGITLTNDRVIKYSTTSPYAKSSLGYMYDLGIFSDLNTDEKNFLSGKKLCVKRKSTGAEYAVSELENVNVRSYDTFYEALSILKKEGCDAFVFDKPMLGYYVATNPRSSFVVRALDRKATSQKYGFIFSRESDVIYDIFESGLQKVIRSGRLDDIVANYEGMVENPYIRDTSLDQD